MPAVSLNKVSHTPLIRAERFVTLKTGAILHSVSLAVDHFTAFRICHPFENMKNYDLISCVHMCQKDRQGINALVWRKGRVKISISMGLSENINACSYACVPLKQALGQVKISMHACELSMLVWD